MSFEQYTWEDRVSEHPNRRTLTYVEDSHTEVVDVAKAEGAVYNTPDDEIAEYNADVMNDIEARIKAAFDAIDADLANTLEAFYPVGSVYISMDNTSPATLFGGTWEAISGGVLVSASTSNSEPQGTDTFSYSPSGTITFKGTVAAGYAELPYHNHYLTPEPFLFDASLEEYKTGTVQFSKFGNDTVTLPANGGSPQQTHTHGFTGSGYLYSISSHAINVGMANVTIYAWQRTA